VDRILDPSFGGCVFLNAAMEALSALGCQNPVQLVFGVDVDPKAIRYAEPILRCGAAKGQFVTADFLGLRPEALGEDLFDVVVGNPPYVKHQWLKGEVRQAAELVRKNAGVKIPGRASYWAYFVAHCLSFLAPGGRLALILPGTFLHADYASEIRQDLVKRFRQVVLILLHERVFRGAQEESVILLAEGYGTDPEYAGIATAESIQKLNDTVSNLPVTTTPLNNRADNGNWLKSVMSSTGVELYEKLSQSMMTIKLGELAKISIGTVTGANAFFALTSEQRRALNIPLAWVRPLIARSSFLRGLTFTDGDWSSMAAHKAARVFLIDTSRKVPLPPPLETYLRHGCDRGIHQAYKCRTRHPWHAVPICPPPDAFLQYMAALQPRLVLNYSRASCTNSIHTVNWAMPLSKKMIASVALSFLSTFTQLSIELAGRSYGGGVLKLEPGEAVRVQLVLPDDGIDNAIDLLDKTDKLLKARHTIEASFLVDTVVLRKCLGLSEKEIQALRNDVSCLVRRRLGKKGASSSLSAEWAGSEERITVPHIAPLS